MDFRERLNLKYAAPTKKLTLLGASGSIGKTTLEVLRRFPQIQLEEISVHTSIKELPKLIEEFQPKQITITDESKFDEFTKNYHNVKIKFYRGYEGLLEMINHSQGDTVLNALTGSIGLEATIEAIKNQKKLCIANKESLVVGGELIFQMLKQYQAPLIPVDSEHNAAFQLLLSQNPKNIRKLILTASGGPFRDYTTEELKKVKKEDVLKHPTWNMGKKITVDSASLINKGLEVIEAHYIFGLPYEKIDVKIHKDSFVHSMIQLNDGSYMLATSPPNMIFPIAHSLFFPEVLPEKLKEFQEPENWPCLKFYPVDKEKYPGFYLCIEAGTLGKSAPIVLNASNEVAVDLFLNDQIHFTEIPLIIKDALENIPIVEIHDFNIILKINREVKEYVINRYKTLYTR
ncbi:MAG: 1-deoxy-D-xylulose-5-phosphate reductoisomerase [Leptospiraceae bacterium]|nr:1-deoxy-D-xylulose-5-phosphate reductoisomerase [Leptospiraceae bacterium]MDW7976693.1 1-deoxy-D-xylulose-5-phosphate reductoisomerase [Leptospiraceae bacterium]